MKLLKDENGKIYFEHKRGKVKSLAFLKDNPDIVEEWHQLFMRLKDPTGFAFQKELFRSFEDYRLFYKNSALFRELLAKWKLELNVYLRSEAIKALVDTTLEGGKASGSSAKYLLEKLTENYEMDKEETKEMMSKSKTQEYQEKSLKKKKEEQEDYSKVADIFKARKKA